MITQGNAPSRLIRSVLASVSALALAAAVDAQTTPGAVLAEQKISSTEGGLLGPLADGDRFGTSVATIGDLNGDEIPDIAVGAPEDDDGGPGRGAVWILLMNADGSVLSQMKISNTAGNFSAVLDDFDNFGMAIAPLGDVDGDNVPDLAVGAPGDDDGGSSHGAIYVLFLDPITTVASFQKISSTAGGFSGLLEAFDEFGSALGAIGDLDGDGITDLAAGVQRDDDGGTSRGAVWVIFLADSGLVLAEQKISRLAGGFSGRLDDFDLFGSAVAGPGDLDGDDVLDLAVGAFGDDDGGSSHGAVWILFLNSDGTVDSFQKISDTEGGFLGELENGDAFGAALAPLGDVNGDGFGDLAVGVLRDNDGGGPERGALWILYLDDDGLVVGEVKISSTEGNLMATLDDGDRFGAAIAALGDVDESGGVDILVGAQEDDDGGTDRGAAYVLFLEGPFQASAIARNGTGVNPTSLLAVVSQPVIGDELGLLLDPGGNDCTVILGQPTPLPTGLMTPYGELLVDISQPPHFVSVAVAPSADQHTVPIPNDPSLVGFPIFAQILRIGDCTTPSGPVVLCEALDIVIGL